MQLDPWVIWTFSGGWWDCHVPDQNVCNLKSWAEVVVTCGLMQKLGTLIWAACVSSCPDKLDVTQQPEELTSLCLKFMKTYIFKRIWGLGLIAQTSFCNTLLEVLKQQQQTEITAPDHATCYFCKCLFRKGSTVLPMYYSHRSTELSNLFGTL